MADLTFSKRVSGDFYHVIYKRTDGTLIGGEEAANTTTDICIRNNQSGTTSWARTKGFTTGTKKVTKVTLYLRDVMNRTWSSSASQYTCAFAISDKLYNVGTLSIPNFGESGWFKTFQGEAYKKTPDGYNGFEVTFDVELYPGKTYYIYIYLPNSGTAWGCLVYPYVGDGTTSTSRTSYLEVTFVNSEPWGLVTICTNITNGTPTWTKATPYICTSIDGNGKPTWTRAVPYLCTALNSGTATWSITR